MSPDPLASSNTASLQPGDLLKEAETADVLNVAVQTLRNWRWKGIGPRVTHVGLRMVRYSRRDLAAFIEAGNGSERAA